MTWAWMVPAVLVGSAAGTLLVVAVRVLAGRRHRGLAVAHTRVLTEQPHFRRALRSYRALLALAALAAVLALVACALLAARLVTSSTLVPETRNRDIVLCLDVSGSMTEADDEILITFDTLARRFAGERLALVLFDDSPASVFPLTTDYEYARTQLVAVRDGLAGRVGGYDVKAATKVANGRSRIGDGFAGCLLQFDRLETDRSRTLILATDYRSLSPSIVSTDQAAAMAVGRDVTVFGLNPVHRDGVEQSVSFQRDVELSGGAYYATGSALGEGAAVTGIVDSVLADEATVVLGAPIRISTDTPDQIVWLLVGATAVLFTVSWRVRP